MKAKFSLLTRIDQRFVTIKIKKGKPIVPEGAGTFYARYTNDTGKRQYKPLGRDLSVAWAEIQTMELAKEYTRRGMEAPPALDVEETGLFARIEAYLEETRANKAKKTWQAYSSSLTYFKASCKRTAVQNVTREDMLAFKNFLRQSLTDRSVYNNFLNVMVFLKWASVRIGIKKDDWPAKPEREPEEYSDEELTALFMAANREERLVLKSFLYSGIRSAELAHLTYGDIDFKHSVWTIRPKLDWNLKTENSQRDIPVPKWHTERIGEWMLALKREKTDLVFPNSKGLPDEHLIRHVKRVARRAGIGGRVDDHKFRSTAITRWLREGNSVQDVMRWVGHKDLATILRYAAKVNVRNAETQRKAASAFEKFATAGGD